MAAPDYLSVFALFFFLNHQQLQPGHESNFTDEDLQDAFVCCRIRERFCSLQSHKDSTSAPPDVHAATCAPAFLFRILSSFVGRCLERRGSRKVERRNSFDVCSDCSAALQGRSRAFGPR